MINIKNVTSKQVIKIMKKLWFIEFHKKWSHIQMKKWFYRITIPDHWNKTLNIKTLYSIIKQSNLTIDEFLENIDE